MVNTMITIEIMPMSDSRKVVDGTVYTILVRLEKNKLVDMKKKPSDMGPPRKFYALNDVGHDELHRFWGKWEFIASKINELKEEK